MSDDAKEASSQPEFQLEDMPLHIGLKFNDETSRIAFVKYRVFMASSPVIAELSPDAAAIWIRRMTLELLSDSLELPKVGKSRPALAAIDGGKS